MPDDFGGGWVKQDPVDAHLFPRLFSDDNKTTTKPHPSDTAWNAGCLGGNPIQSFDFIKDFGLSTAAAYPYKAEQLPCRKEQVAPVSCTCASTLSIHPSLPRP